jgi:hypothetical protein
VALIVYLRVAIVKKRLGPEASLQKIPQTLSLTLFEKTPILQALAGTNYQLLPDVPSNQLSIFDL